MSEVPSDGRIARKYVASLTSSVPVDEGSHPLAPPSVPPSPSVPFASPLQVVPSVGTPLHTALDHPLTPSSPDGSPVPGSIQGSFNSTVPTSSYDCDHPAAASSSPIDSPHVVRDPVERFMGSRIPARRRLGAWDVSADASGLKTLVDEGAWRAVVTLAEMLLSKPHAPHELLQFKCSRVLSLIRMRQFTDASGEFESMGSLDDPAYSYERFPSHYPNRVGSMVPFTLRLLHAQLPQQALNNPALAVDRLYKLLNLCWEEQVKLEALLCGQDSGSSSPGPSTPPSTDEGDPMHTMLGPRSLRRSRSTSVSQPPSSLPNVPLLDAPGSAPGAPVQPWGVRERNVVLCLVGCHVRMQDYELALRLMEHLITKDPDDPTHIARQARVFLQAGNVQGAENAVVRLERLVGGSTPLVTMSRGFLAVAHDDYRHAASLFRDVLEQEPGNPVVANNLAICLLYSGDLAAAVQCLEDVIRVDPRRCLTETVASNLCTLYDLSPNNSSASKKKVIQEIASRFCDDDFDFSSLKLQQTGTSLH